MLKSKGKLKYEQSGRGELSKSKNSEILAIYKMIFKPILIKLKGRMNGTSCSIWGISRELTSKLCDGFQGCLINHVYVKTVYVSCICRLRR